MTFWTVSSIKNNNIINSISYGLICEFGMILLKYFYAPAAHPVDSWGIIFSMCACMHVWEEAFSNGLAVNF